MIRANTMDVLLRMGMPAGVKGTTYICDAMALFQSDPYYTNGKISSLYADIAKKHETTASSVERAIRHAFETTLIKGDSEILEKYLDVSNAQNSNLLKSLYFRLRHEELKNRDVVNCNPESCKMKKQIYQEAMTTFFTELEHAIKKRLESS